MVYPLIVYDFETCNDYAFSDFKGLDNNYRNDVISSKTLPLELSLLYIKYKGAKPIYSKIKVKYPKRIENCTKNEIETLCFYFKNQFDKEDISKNELIKLLKDHNKVSVPIQNAFRKFLLFIKKNIGTIDLDKEKIGPFTLVGKNNYNYDDIILNNFLSTFYPNYLYILKNSWDLQDFIFKCGRSKELPFSIKEKFRFLDYSLSGIYEGIFGKKMQNAHDSKYDVIATYKIFNYYNSMYPKLVLDTLNLSFIDLREQFKTFSYKEVVK